ncbi:MAG: CoA transferase [Chloroflexi bacterium]|nr:CoA transferase [Chloroflexota bacterium]
MAFIASAFLPKDSGRLGGRRSERAPLSKIRVLDVTHVFAAPYADGLLGDLGAEVIRIVAPDRVDMMAPLGPFPDGEPGERFWDRVGSLNTVNRGKYGLGLNLKDPRGADIFRELVKISDVVVEGFTREVMASFGLDYPALRRIKPDIIMLSNSAYGHSGPWSDWGGVATGLEATTGMTHLSGYEDGPPTKVGASYTDFITTWSIVIAVLSALHYRRRTGKGQWIDVSMYQVGASTIGEALLDYIVNGRVQTRHGNRLPGMAPCGVYRCKGVDEWIALSVETDQEWKLLCAVMGKPAMGEDSRYRRTADRLLNQPELDAAISEWTEGLEHYQVMQLLQEAGVAAGAVLNNKELHLDPHLRSRGFYQKAEHSPATGIGTRFYIGEPWRFSKGDVRIRKAAPAVGEDNVLILTQLLGCSEDEVHALTNEGVIGTGPRAVAAPPAISPQELVARKAAVSFDSNYQDILGTGDPHPARKHLGQPSTTR